MPFVIKHAHEERWVEEYDVDWLPPEPIEGVTGRVWWTTDRSKALVFATMTDAIETWRRQSTTVPMRIDGKPNRPLTAYSVAIERL